MAANDKVLAQAKRRCGLPLLASSLYHAAAITIIVSRLRIPITITAAHVLSIVKRYNRRTALLVDIQNQTDHEF